MAPNPVRTAAAATGGLVTGTLLETIVKRFGYVLNVGESLGGLDFNVGEPPLLVHSAATGFDYYLDTTDTTTPSDGLTCLVSGNGLRYHIEDAASLSLNAVVAFAGSPPGSPVVGDAYIVSAAATGAFAGKDNNVAVYTRRGWIYATPELGLSLYNQATGTNWQYGNAGWAGLAVELADLSVRPEKLLKALGIAVESTLNTPPGSPAANTYWLVGTSPTGAFVGHPGDVAYFRASSWQFITRYEGAEVFHKGLGYELHYVSGAWVGEAGATSQTFSTAGAAIWNKPAKGAMALIECWGAGGSGGRGGTGDGGGGGGGGSYRSLMVPLSLLGSSVSVTVGAGGAAVTVNDTDGNVGGNTSFGTWVTAYGGGGGAGNVGTAGGGGGGAGQGSVGQTSAGAGGGVSNGGNGGTDILGNAGAVGSTSSGSSALSAGTGAAGGGGAASGAGRSGGAADEGGGGGGGGCDAGSSAGGTGGASIKGGAGGGGANGASGSPSVGVGGVSVYGGNGGASGVTTGNGVAGQSPGGGGGGSVTGNSGKGGDGMVRVTVF